MAASFSAFSRRLSRCLCRNSNPTRSITPFIRINPQNPSRRISYSTGEKIRLSHPNLGILGSTEGYSFGWRSPFPLQADRKTLFKPGQRATEEEEISNKYETLLQKYETLLQIQRTQMEKNRLLHADHHTPAPGFVSCAIMPDAVHHTTTLHFSTFHSDGELLKKFSIPLTGLEAWVPWAPWVRSASRNLFLLMEIGPAFMCNIDTQQLIYLPNKEYDFHTDEVMGFGYVPSTKEYKLLLKLSTHLPGLDFKVLTLGADRWHDVQDPPLYLESPHSSGTVFANGAIHLPSRHRDKILAFNLEREEWGLITAPPVSPHYSLSEFTDGYLCALHKTASGIDIWLLDYNNNASWFKECTVSFSAWNDGPLYKVKPLAIEDDGRILVLVDRKTDKYSLQSYDPKTKSSQEIHPFYRSPNFHEFYVKVFSSLGHR